MDWRECCVGHVHQQYTTRRRHNTTLHKARQDKTKVEWTTIPPHTTAADAEMSETVAVSWDRAAAASASDVNTSTTVQVAVKGRERRGTMVFYCRRHHHHRHRCSCCCSCFSMWRPNAAVVDSVSASAKLHDDRSWNRHTCEASKASAVLCSLLCRVVQYVAPLLGVEMFKKRSSRSTMDKRVRGSRRSERRV